MIPTLSKREGFLSQHKLVGALSLLVTVSLGIVLFGLSVKARPLSQIFSTWYLAEGYTGGSFDTWILIQNPGATEATVEVTYMPEGESPITRTHTVPGNSRYTIHANEASEVGPGKSFSTKLVSDQPIIVERAMYWDAGGAHWAGGHNSIGVSPPLEAPSNLMATSVSTSQIDLSWTDNSDDEDDFHIERSPDGINWTEIATVPANTTSYSDTGLDCGTEYHYRVRAHRHSDDQYSGWSNETVATTQPCPTYSQRVNAGGPAYTDGAGKAWAADQAYSPGSWGYVGGSTFAVSDPIARTVDDPLYQSERYGLTEYRFDVPNGTYEVELRFAEIWFSASGQRVFDVRIEGTTFLTDFDPYAAAGGHDVALNLVLRGIVVVDGQLNIEFAAKEDNPKVSAIRVEAAPEPPSPFGVEMLSINDDRIAKAVGADMRWVRILLAWKDIEPNNTTPGHYNWGAYDSRIKSIVDAGLVPLVTVQSNPDWAATTELGPIDKVPLSEFVQFVTALVERYDGDGVDDAPGSPVVKYWELYNEMDNEAHWGYQGDKYAELLKAAYPAIKAANPEAKVVFGGLAYEWFTDDDDAVKWCYAGTGESHAPGPHVQAFLNEVLSNLSGPQFPYFDILAFHSYESFRWRWDRVCPDRCASYPGECGVDIVAKANYIRWNELTPYGLQDIPLICNEIGTPSAPLEEGYTEEGQSQYVVQGFARGMAAQLPVIIWFTLADYPDPRQYGLLYADLSPKPAYYAYQTMTTELRGYSYLRTIPASELGTEHTDIEAYEFVDGTGKRKVVLTLTWDPQQDRRVAFTATRLRVVDKYGSEVVINDGGEGDLDRTQNGKITINATLDPHYMERCP